MRIFTTMIFLMLSTTAFAQVDSDSDGVDDAIDNCVGCWNPTQADADEDGLGDCWLCDHCDGPGNDEDWDRVCDGVDNCVGAWNASQTDSDGDGIGDFCDNGQDPAPDPDPATDPDPAPDPEPEPTPEPEPEPEPTPTPECSGDPLRYDPNAGHSPLNCLVIAHLESVIASQERDDSMIMRVGDSHSVSTNHLSCFAHTFFEGFQRIGLAVAGGQTASWASQGPLLAEIEATNARFALILFGTNDLWYGGGPDGVGRKYQWFYDSMTTLIEDSLAAGVVPVLSTIPPHHGTNEWFGPLVGGFNAIVFGLGEHHEVPVINLHDALVPLPGHGLMSDGIHMNRLGHGLTCEFTDVGLEFGHNVRNFLVSEALDRLHGALFAATPLNDGSLSPLVGLGSSADPFIVDGLSFFNTGTSSHYALTVTADTHVRVVFLNPDDETDVILVAPDGTVTDANDKTFVGTLTPGVWSIAAEDAGEFAFTMTECVNAGCAP